jgi:hypothetical protein
MEMTPEQQMDSLLSSVIHPLAQIQVMAEEDRADSSPMLFESLAPSKKLIKGQLKNQFKVWALFRHFYTCST